MHHDALVPPCVMGVRGLGGVGGSGLGGLRVERDAERRAGETLRPAT